MKPRIKALDSLSILEESKFVEVATARFSGELKKFKAKLR